MEFWWHFGCNLAAVSRLRFTSTGNTRTATKLPPHHHQLSTKMPPNLPNGHRNDGTETKKHQGSTEYVPKLYLCSNRIQKSTHFSTFLLPLRLKILLWDEGFCQSDMLHSFLWLQCSWLYSMRTLWPFDLVLV